MLPNAEGRKVPQVTFRTREDGQWKDVTTDEIFKRPHRGASSRSPAPTRPPARRTHLPRYNELAPVFRKVGVDEIVCLSVNDAFVMSEWQQDQNAPNVTFIPDGNGEFTDGMGMLVDKSDLGFGKRSWRYSMLVQRRRDREDVHRAREGRRPVRGVRRRHDARLRRPAREGARAGARVRQARLPALRPRQGRCSRSHGVVFEEVALGKGITSSSLRAVSGKGTTPQVFIGGRSSAAPTSSSATSPVRTQGRVRFRQQSGTDPHSREFGVCPDLRQEERMESKLQVDVAVIGAGTAGLAAYRAARAAGARAVIIEGGTYGTTCARVGCMPSKLLIAAAEAAHAVERASGFGVHAGAARIDGREVMARVKRERDRFVGFVLEGVEAIPEADRMRGHARFLDRNTLEVEGGPRISARAIVIATGSRPAVPADPARTGRSARRERRRLRLGHAAALGRGLRPRRDRPRAGPGAGAPRRARGGARPRRPRGPPHRPRRAKRRHRGLRRRSSHLDPDAHVTRVERIGDAGRGRIPRARRGPAQRALRLRARRHRPHAQRGRASASSAPASSWTIGACPASTPARCRRATAPSSSPATHPTSCRCCTRRPTRAASRATTRRDFPPWRRGTAPRAAGHRLHRSADRHRGRRLRAPCTPTRSPRARCPSRTRAAPG